MKKPVIVGAASGSVSVGLALILILLSLPPDTETSKQEPPSARIVKPAPKAPAPVQAAVFLPPPPALRAPPSKPEPSKPEPPKAKPPQAKQPLAKPQLTKSVAPRQKPPPAQPTAKPVIKPRPPPKRSVPLRPPSGARAAEKKSTKPPPPVKAVALLSVTPEAVSEGRALLRMLEVGKGPTIEIVWPPTPAQRDRLYSVLERCYGLRTALMAEDGRIYFEEGPAGAPTQINRDRTSGFVRRPTGAMPSAERRLVARIQRRHKRAGLTPVRLFPRHVDAVLLAGIRQIIGRDYGTLRRVRARYVSNGTSVLIGDITADNGLRNGQIKLPQIGFNGCE